MKINKIITIFAIAMSLTATAQEKYASPVNFAITLAGNVGEIRADHFHTGIDVKALQGVGSPIYAIADGYVSRLGVSPWGYGNVVYVTHKDGAVSVYGHLDRFVSKIAQWVVLQQLAKKSFAVDLYPAAGQFPVKQGEQIAMLGNSGSSGGPHLHLEIRENGKPINIISRGIYSVGDHVKPTVKSIKLFEIDTIGGIAVHTLKQSVVPSDTAVLKLRRNGYLAYEVIDYKDGKSNTMGVYSIEQKVNDTVNYSFFLDELDFNTGRYINTFTAFPENGASKIDVLRAYVSENNLLKIYKNVRRRGVIRADKNEILVETKITDDALNETIVKLKIVRDTTESNASVPADAKEVRWKYDFNLKEPMFAVTINGGSLYDNYLMRFYERDGVYFLGNKEVSLHKPMWLTVDAPIGLQPTKIGIVSVNADGKVGGWSGGTYKNGKITASVKKFGNYKVMQDTIAPKITVLSLAVKGGKQLKFRLSDNLSGVADYSLTVDGKWVLAEYDGKTATLTHTIKRAQTPVKHDVVVAVVDAVGNKTTIKKEVLW